MRKKFMLGSAVTLLATAVALPVNAAPTTTLDQRVQRLERMMENPVLLQLSRRLGEQQREIQNLQDQNDRLKRDLRQLRALMDERYKETDERFSLLEGTQPRSSLISTPSATTTNETFAPANSVEAAVPVASMPEVSSPTTAEVPEMPALAIPEMEVQTEAAVQESNNAETAIAQTQVQKQPSTSGVIQTRAATQVEKDKYKNAFSLMRSSKYEDSIQQFEAFMQNHPESDLASNAAYWAGEGYLVVGKEQQALDSFLKVLNQYPDSPKVPDATLRAGDSYERLGNSKKAVEMYEMIIQERPHSRAAENARKRLEN